MKNMSASKTTVEEVIVHITDQSANPAALGLLAFGMTTVLLNTHNAGFYAMNAMILSMGIFYGGLAQVIAGIMEWKKNNTFGATAFTSYGFFWLSLVALIIMPEMGLPAATNVAMAAYLAVWGVLTAVLLIGTLRINRALQLVFLSLTILFFLLSAGEAMGNEMIVRIAGFEGIFCGISAIYAGSAQVINQVYGKTFMPLGMVKKGMKRNNT